MTSGKKAAIAITSFLVLAVGIELAYLHHERNSPGKVVAPEEYGKTDPDDLVFLRKERPSSLADAKQMAGSTVWMAAGGQLEYYPYAAHRANYAKAVGTLLGAEPLAIKDAFEQVAPQSATFRIPGGDKQVLLAFTLPKSADPTAEYAVPVGYKQNGQYTFYTDDVFFYDDPHKLFDYWSPQVWQAIDTHQAVLGMNERQVQLALGQVSKPQGDDYGNRQVIYANLGHAIAVTFVNDKATAVEPSQGY